MTAPATVEAARQYLTFVVGEEEYALDILGVQEIRSLSPITRLPHAPTHVLGVINLRGAVVPVVDLRRRLGLASAAWGPVTAIVVVQVGSRVVGLIVDKVSDVVAVPEEALRPLPAVDGILPTQALSGLLTVAERLVLVLDVARLLDDPVPAGDSVGAGAPPERVEDRAVQSREGEIQ